MLDLNRAPAARAMFVVLVLAIAGCGGRPPGQVEGMITLKGAPLSNVAIQFIPDPAQGTNGPVGRAISDENGRYRLIADDRSEYVESGWHRVVIEDLDKKQLAQGEIPKEPATRVPPRYSSAATTPLHKEVKPGQQTIDLEIDPK